MIVKNEENMLPACLESVRSVVDEIIIVDTGSTDSTREIAEKYNARWFSYAWKDDFSAARNYSLGHAAGDWILVLDADERLTPDNARKIRNTVDTAADIAYYLNFRSPVHSSSAGNVLIHQYARLFRNGKNIRFDGRIHEQIIESVNRAGGKILPSAIYVDHYGYIDSEMDVRGKHERNIRILSRELEDDPGNGIVCYYLGESYSLLREWKKAIEFYEKGASAANVPQANRALIWQNLGSAYYNEGKYSRAVDCERTSLQISPDRLTPHTVLAESAMALGKYDLAVWEWSIVLERTAESPKGEFNMLSDFVPDPVHIRLRMADAYFRNKDFRNARKTCESALAIDGDAVQVRILLAQIQSAENDFLSARSTLRTLLENDSENAAVLMMLGKIEGNLGNYRAASACFEKVMELHPGNEDALSSLETVRKISETEDSPDKHAFQDRPKADLLFSEKHAVEALLREGKIDEAEKKLSSLLLSHRDYELYFLSAFAAKVRGNLDEVIRYCTEALKQSDDDPRVYYLLGGAYAKKGSHEDAARAFERAVALQPNMAEAWTSLGVAAVNLMDFNRAKSAFEQAHKLNPEDMQLKRNLAAVCGRLGLMKEAERYLLMIKM